MCRFLKSVVNLAKGLYSGLHIVLRGSCTSNLAERSDLHSAADKAFVHVASMALPRQRREPATRCQPSLIICRGDGRRTESETVNRTRSHILGFGTLAINFVTLVSIGAQPVDRMSACILAVYVRIESGTMLSKKNSWPVHPVMLGIILS